MIDLIFWSFVMALTPWMLDLGWRLFGGGGS
jgi:hypothetical protein